MLRNDHIATPLRKASRMAAEHYTTGIGATLYKVHVEGGEVGLVGRQIATKVRPCQIDNPTKLDVRRTP